MKRIKTCIFDLDGVIVDTAKYHFKAWRRMANTLGFDFSEKENEKLKGVSRMESLELILKWGGKYLTEPEKKTLASQKNDWYCSMVEKMTSEEILEGVLPFLNSVQQQGLSIVLGSASRNAGLILDLIELRPYFDAVIDGNQVKNGKPNPEVFLKGAMASGAAPDECIVFEDAEKGVEAALNGGFWAVGIGEAAVLGKAHLVIPSFVDWPLEKIIAHLKNDDQS